MPKDLYDLVQDAEIANLDAQHRAADGLTTDVLGSLTKQIAMLRQEVARQNVALTVLTQQLIERGGVDAATLATRYQEALAQAQAQANLVACARCGKRVDKRVTFITGSGAMCQACHQVMMADE
jgi:hypothetical protein